MAAGRNAAARAQAQVPEGALGESGAGKGDAALLAAVVFVAFLDNFAQLPILAPMAASLGAGALLAGATVGAYSLTNLVGNLAVAAALDRRGPAAPLVVSLAATAVVLAGYGVARDPWTLLVLRLLHGGAAAAIVPAVFALTALRAARAAPHGPLGRMSALGATIGLAAVAAPPAAGLTATRAGYGAVYLALALLFAAAALAVEVRRRGWPWASAAGRTGRQRPGAATPLGLSALLAQGSGRGLPMLWAGAAALMFAVGSLALLLPLELGRSHAGAGSLAAGKLLAVFSLTALVVMVGLARVRGGGSAPALLALGGGGLLAVALALAGLGGLHHAAGPHALMALFGIGFGLAFPSLAAGVALRAPREAQGRAFALFYACFSAGALLGPLSAGLVAQTAAEPGRGYLPAIVLAAAAGGLALVAAHRERGRGAWR